MEQPKGEMTPTPEQIAKLPKWAQAHLYRLEKEHVEAKRKLAELLGFERTLKKQNDTNR